MFLRNGTLLSLFPHHHSYSNTTAAIACCSIAGQLFYTQSCISARCLHPSPQRFWWQLQQSFSASFTNTFPPFFVIENSTFLGPYFAIILLMGWGCWETPPEKPPVGHQTTDTASFFSGDSVSAAQVIENTQCLFLAGTKRTSSVSQTFTLTDPSTPWTWLCTGWSL